MKSITFALVLLLSYSILNAQKIPMYVGTYTSNGSKGVQIYDFDESSGESSFVRTIEMSNPSFLAREGNVLYVVNEGSHGLLTAIDLNKNSTLNSLPTNGGSPCHVSLSPIDPVAVVSNYSGGSLVLFSVNDDGSLKKKEDFIQFAKSSINKKRQEKSHIHSAFFTQDGKYLFVSDLGADLVYKIAVEKESSGFKFNIIEEIPTKLGGGPRHVLISKDGNRLYVVLELTGELEVIEKSNKEWKSRQILSIFSSGFRGVQGAADIKASADGKFVYATNRGEVNQLVVYKTKKNGLLEPIQILSVEGNSPRNVQLSPNGKLVIVSNQLTGNLSFFNRNKKTGKLTFKDKTIAIPSAVCVVF